MILVEMEIFIDLYVIGVGHSSLIHITIIFQGSIRITMLNKGSDTSADPENFSRGGPTLCKKKPITNTGDQHFEVKIAGLSDETLIPRPRVTARVGMVKIPHCSMAPSADVKQYAINQSNHGIIINPLV